MSDKDKTLKELQKEYNDFVDSLDLGDLHLKDEDITVTNMWKKRDWIRTIKNNLGKLQTRFDRVYDKHTAELEKYVREQKDIDND